jgi:pyrroline-5-carboxylate reductase
MNGFIGIIGFGNMGSAIGNRIKSEYTVWAFDKDENKTDNLSGISVAGDLADLVNRVDAVILAVKPQDFDTLLTQIKQYIHGRLIISIAAGISTEYIENKLGEVRVIRVMPNLAAKIGKGMICLCKGSFATDNDLDFAKVIFDFMGATIIIKEKMMDAATAVSGSGPGFFYHLIQGRPNEEWGDYASKEFIPALSASAQRVGFNSGQAELLAKKTAEGSIALLKETGLSPEALRMQVASKGGTTEAGLKALQSINSLGRAVEAALKRAGELSKE